MEFYKHKDIFEVNTKKDFFPHHNISYELILLWLNRHLLVEKLVDMNARYYCHLDWGYFRDLDKSKIKIDTSNLQDDKIYFGLIKNEEDYLKNIYNLIKDWSKENIEKTLIDNLYSFGGGGSLMSKDMIFEWLKIFKYTFNKFIEKKIDFKDDQTIIRQIIMDKENNSKFFAVTEGIGDWFPFIRFLKNNNNELLLENNFNFL